jgi:hypothetical protein
VEVDRTRKRGKKDLGWVRKWKSFRCRRRRRRRRGWRRKAISRKEELFVGVGNVGRLRVMGAGFSNVAAWTRGLEVTLCKH